MESKQSKRQNVCTHSVLWMFMQSTFTSSVKSWSTCRSSGQVTLLVLYGYGALLWCGLFLPLLNGLLILNTGSFGTHIVLLHSLCSLGRLFWSPLIKLTVTFCFLTSVKLLEHFDWQVHDFSRKPLWGFLSAVLGVVWHFCVLLALTNVTTPKKLNKSTTNCQTTYRSLCMDCTLDLLFSLQVC